MSKMDGCSNLILLLQQKPSVMLARTGLGEVFEEALMPCLLHLPSLTEESHSVALLEKAYPALIKLTCVRFSEPEQRPSKIKSLDRIMRYGVLKGFAHAGEHANVARTLVSQVAELTEHMKIDVAKHMKVSYLSPTALS